MLARAFPPALDAGAFRPSGFARYLPEFGYLPVVLSQKPSESDRTDPGLLDGLPEEVAIHHIAREPGRDAHDWLRMASQLVRPAEVICGKQKKAWSNALVERITNRLPQLHKRERLKREFVHSGLKIIEEVQPSLIWATAPPMGTIKAADELSRRSGLPLVIDIRDPISYGLQSTFYNDHQRRYVRACETSLLKQASRAVFVSPLTQACMEARYPMFVEKFTTINNGLDLADDRDAANAGSTVRNNRMTICFAGTIYLTKGQVFRDPTVLMDAMQILAREQPNIANDICLRFIGDCPGVIALAEERNLAGLIEADGMVDYATCKQMMREADVLLLLQTISGDGKDVISGKLYDYLGTGKPVLGVVPEGGGDEWLMLDSGAGPNVGISDPQRISRAIVDLWKQWQKGPLTSNVPDGYVEQFDRRHLSNKLASLFDDVLGVSSPMELASESV